MLKVGRLKSWKVGEDWKIEKLEDWKIRRNGMKVETLKSWRRIGTLKNWKIGRAFGHDGSLLAFFGLDGPGKFFHCHGRRAVDSLCLEDFQHRHQQDPKVKEERLIFNVPDIISKFLLP